MSPRFKLNLIRATVAICAAAAVITGVTQGEAASVYQKAIRICMECIGLG